MKRLAFFALLGILAALPASGDDVPFAEPPITKPGENDTYLVGLSDLMLGAQLRHMKLWQAIKAKNWDLAGFELNEMEESLTKAAMLYRNIPMENISAALTPLGALRDALKAKDGAGAERGFADLTGACNLCHQAAGVGFIVIKTPAASPFSNQSFSPAKK